MTQVRRSGILRCFFAVLVSAGGLVVMRPAEGASLVSTLATPSQRLLDRLAERLAAAQPVRAEAATLTTLWRGFLSVKLGGLSAQNEKLLAPTMRELTSAYAQMAANSDPDRPKVSWIESPPHEWFGDRVPGGRYAADNPDTIYRIVPINGVSTYQIHGRFVGQRPATTLYQVVTDRNLIVPVSELDQNELVIRRDGSFTITIGPGPPNGRANYLQTDGSVVELFVRDTLSNWSTQTAPLLSVKRISGPPIAPAPTFNQLVTRTATFLKTGGDLWIGFYIMGMLFAPSANAVPAPSAGPGGIYRSSGNFDLTGTEALVITAQPAGAAYVGLALSNVWAMTPEYWDHQSSLTNGQAVPNADGTYTFVVSRRDPGVYNWVDTAGLEQGTFLLRWQGLPPADRTAPSVQGRVVDLAHLDSVLPVGTRIVTPKQRASQLAEREAGFDRRVSPGSPGL